MNIKDLFISLTETTTPFKTWLEDRDDLISKIPLNLSKDRFGNFYYKVGMNSKCMFTCHLDTYSDVSVDVKHVIEEDIIKTDGNSILGADDKAGVVVLVNMINNNIPGLYYFFIAEEIGSKGSKKVAENFYDLEYCNGIERVISFDRKGYDSIITHQNKIRCCSDRYADWLVESFSKGGLKMIKDDTGGISDSMSFKGVERIKEITNISVGYFNEHTVDEYLDLSFLNKLIKVVIDIDWDRDMEVNINERLITSFDRYVQIILDNEKMSEDYKNTSWTVDENGKEITISIGDIEEYLKGEKIVNILVEDIKEMSIHKDKTNIETIERINKSNLKYPIIITTLNGSYYSILDGNHRLQKAINENKKYIKALILNLDIAPNKYKVVFS